MILVALHSVLAHRVQGDLFEVEMEIRSRNNLLILIDEADFGSVSSHLWYAYKIGNTFYARDEGGNYLHRLVMQAPKGMQVDHINGNGLDNRRSNLRVCTHKDNHRNARKRVGALSSQYKGVSWFNESGWHAQIEVDDKHFSVRTETELQAAQTYDALARYYFGEYARTNFDGNDAISFETAKTIRHTQRKQNTSSKYRGVNYWITKNKWQAGLMHNHIRYRLGTFDTEEEAAHAVDKKLKKLHGTQALLNFPE